jgi:hypothetical protein
LVAYKLHARVLKNTGEYKAVMTDRKQVRRAKIMEVRPCPRCDEVPRPPRASHRPPPAPSFAPPRRKPTTRTPLAARAHGPTPCECLHSLHTRILQHTLPTSPHTPTPALRAQTMHTCSRHSHQPHPPPPAALHPCLHMRTPRHDKPKQAPCTCTPHTCLQGGDAHVPRPALA